MLYKSNFFKNFSSQTRLFRQSLKKTKKNFKILCTEIKNFQIPMLISYDKDYEFDFSEKTIKKFSRYKNIIIIGMGGSILGAKSAYSFFHSIIKKNVFFFDNLDLNLILKYKKIKNLKNSCFIIISKSGNTLETVTNLGAIFSKELLKNKLIIITELMNNSLMKIGNKFNAEIIEHKKFIGGRYSIFSETGMFPAALMGLDIKKFKNIKKFINDNNFVSSLIQNVAAIHVLDLKGINNSVILSYDSSLNDLGYWYQQLTAESLGKKGKGIYPTLSFGPKDHHSLLQLYLDGPRDKFFTFLNTNKKENNYKISQNIFPNNLNFLKSKNLKYIINAQCNATKNIFESKKIPFRQITFKQKSEEELGKIYTFFVLETILLSRLINVNPFDQPAVEEVKVETKKFLS